MNKHSAEQARDILRALAALSPDAAATNASASIPLEWFRWINLGALTVFTGFTGEMPADILVEAAYAERLTALSQVRGGSAIRMGWLFLAGRVRHSDGRHLDVFAPIISAHVRVWRQPLTGFVHAVRVGDVEISDLITDVGVRHELESRIEYGGGGFVGSSLVASPSLLTRMPRLRAFAADVARAVGMPGAELVPAWIGPEELMQREPPALVAGVALYSIREERSEVTRSASLRRWAEADLGDATALHALYAEVESPRRVDAAVRSSLRLTPTQTRAVEAAATQPVTVIEGAPGTGKSHTLVAIALDAIQRDESVLVVAKTDATVDALIELLQQSPAPEPVVFGSNERREALAQRLSEGGLHPVRGEAVLAAEAETRRLEAQFDATRRRIAEQLRIEQKIQQGSFVAGTGSLSDAQARARELLALVSRARGARGWRAKWGAASAHRALRQALACPADLSDDDVVTMACEEVDEVAARCLMAEGGLGLGELWRELAFRDDRARRAHGTYLSMAYREESRLTRETRAAVSALAVALRSGRAARREQLRNLHRASATRALPLWIGTLGDVDDLLPVQPGFFDLVILDEAASIDQPLAAPALLRGKRAVIAGDPRQLRQVSFLSDDEISRAVEHVDDELLRAQLDVRRNSVLDVAVGVSEPIVLNEHFRSVPHLVGFIAKRLYGDHVFIASRKPSTHNRDCIDVVRCSGVRDRDKVVHEEIEVVLREVRNARARDATSVGIVTPFRSQADALERQILATYSSEQLEAMDMRIGTVHGFQGNERDLMIVSLGVGEGANAPWAFVEDLSLAAVLLTRARERLVVVYAGDPPARGLIADFLAQADAPPGPPPPNGPSSNWVMSLEDGVTTAGIRVRRAYPTGRHTADLVVDDNRDIAIEADIHPDGVESHIRRRLEMMDRGWTFEEAYRSKWSGREAELVVDLVGRLRSSPPR
ncbi:MAG: hypothetical protein QOJ00_2032 [Actinomycetota bacterium]